MEFRNRATLLAVLACAAVPALSACGGGGDFLAWQDAQSAPLPIQPAAPPAPLSPAAPPPPPPPAGPTSAGPQPVLFLEKNPDGAMYLRVQEQVHEPFAATRLIEDREMGPSPGYNFVVEGAEKTRIANVDAIEMKHGLTMQASADVSIYDYTYTKFNGGGSIYGAAMKLGDNGRPTNGSTYIQRVVADGMQTPDSTYKVSNNDFIGIERDSGPIYVRDASGKNFGDGGIDTKSGPVYMMNVTLEKAHRMVRAWEGVEIVLVNSIINGTAGHSQGWVSGNGSKIRYYNTLWCMDSENPSPSDPKCSTSPSVVESDDMSLAEAKSRFIPLQANPLPEVSPFFKTSIDEIKVEYSTDGGKTWNALSLPNAGKPGAGPIGDPRFKLPLNLADADYRFRASYLKNGGRVGEMSLVIDEGGATT